MGDVIVKAAAILAARTSGGDNNTDLASAIDRYTEHQRLWSERAEAREKAREQSRAMREQWRAMREQSRATRQQSRANERKLRFVLTRIYAKRSAFAPDRRNG
jgi:hypothetical protein